MRLVLCLIFVALLLPAAASAGGFDHGYAGWDSVLRQNVDSRGQVDYGALKASEGLAAFVASLAQVAPEDISGWSRDRQVAFWINAYNALTFQTILEAGTPASIRDIQPDPWENSRWSVAGRTVSLNWIEHAKLRGQLQEPRVHFVLVCAARGCPTLPARAVQPEKLGAQLESFTRAFLTDPNKNRVDVGAKKVYLSRILEWYGSDFQGAKGTPELAGVADLGEREAAVIRYLARHVGDAERAMLDAGGFTIVYNEYDWGLNKQ